MQSAAQAHERVNAAQQYGHMLGKPSETSPGVWALGRVLGKQMTHGSGSQCGQLGTPGQTVSMQ